MVRISCVMGTAREDHSIDGMLDTHIFEPTIRGLKRQRFDDFELIISDELYESRKDYFEVELPFEVKHVPPKNTPYAGRGVWRSANTFNTTFLHAEGELIIILGDCGEYLDPHALEKYWRWYEEGYFVASLFTYYYQGRQLYVKDENELKELLKKKDKFRRRDKLKLHSSLWSRNEAVRDTRWDAVHGRGVVYDAPDSWYYGYCSVSLDAILKVNGFDELFDGGKGLVDCDLGSRLQMAHYQFVVDPDLVAVEHWHKFVSTKVVTYEGKRWKSNYALYQLNKLRNRFRANSEVLTDEDVEYIKRESIGWDEVAKEDVENPIFDWWVKNQPIFSLREMRLQ